MIVAETPPESIRFVRRVAVEARSVVEIQVPRVRPSLLDLRFRGDAWLQRNSHGTFSLLLGNFRVAQIVALPFDQPSLNGLLSRVRHTPGRNRP